MERGYVLKKNVCLPVQVFLLCISIIPLLGCNFVHSFPKVKLEVDVGSEYTPDDVTVEFSRNQIHVKAKHEEKMTTGRTAKREYSRSFDIPEKIDPKSLRAVLSSDGYLLIQASLTSNRDVRAAMNSIKRDMAQGGIPVNIMV